MESDRVGTIDLSLEPLERKPVVANLLQLHLHDFSAFAEIGTELVELGPDGRFAYEWLDLYWMEEGRVPLTIRADGRLVGLVLINRWAYLDRPLDRAMAEFFVLRKYRRHRVGARAAALAFARFPGRWQVPVARDNAPALAFWRHAIRDVIGCPAPEIPVEGERWSNPGVLLRHQRRSGCPAWPR